LDHTHVQYSFKRTCMVTLTVGDVEGIDEWHLPTYDPHNENKYHYKLHSLDIYFWTQGDALQFLGGIRRVLPPAQCEILDEPGPPARRSAEVSSVVQKLEDAALDDNTPTGQARQPNGAASGARPPTSAVPGPTTTTTTSSSQGFVPMAYNPAAPAAPEQIRHREKTPPPEDGGINPLQQTLAIDAATPISPGMPSSGFDPRSPGLPPPQFRPPPGEPLFPGPPQQGATSPGVPPQYAGITRAQTVPTHGLPNPGLPSPYGARLPGPPGPPASSGYNPQSYSNSGAGEYAIHQQVYVPADGEEVKHKPKKEVRGRLEENAGRLERGVTGMLKKLDKKFG
jgi:hypothetical protein